MSRSCRQQSGGSGRPAGQTCSRRESCAETSGRAILHTTQLIDSATLYCWWDDHALARMPMPR